MKNSKIFKRTALAVLSTGIILTTFAECSLDSNNFVESEKSKQSSVEMMEETKANETEKTSKKESSDENKESNIKGPFIGLTTIGISLLALNVIWKKNKNDYYAENLKLDSNEKDSKQKTYHR